MLVHTVDVTRKRRAGTRTRLRKAPVSRNGRDAFSVLFVSIETTMETRRTELTSKLG